VVVCRQVSKGMAKLLKDSTEPRRLGSTASSNSRAMVSHLKVSRVTGSHLSKGMGNPLQGRAGMGSRSKVVLRVVSRAILLSSRVGILDSSRVGTRLRVALHATRLVM